MISAETAASFVEEIQKAGDTLAITKMMAEFLQEEPNLVAWLSTYWQAIPSGDNLSTALTTLTLYNKMRQRQESSDKLKDEIG